jgi:hypothetical protein
MSRGRVDGMREEKVGPHRSADLYIGKAKPPSVSRGGIGRADKAYRTGLRIKLKL